MPTRYCETKPTEDFCCFYQPSARIPGRKARAGLWLPLPGGRSEPAHGLLLLTLPETPGFEQHEAAEIPPLTETTPLPQTQTCFAPTTDSDLALRRYPSGKAAPGSALPARRCLRPRRTAHGGGGARAGAGGRARHLRLSPRTPRPASHPVLERNPDEHWHPRAVGASAGPVSFLLHRRKSKGEGPSA